MAKTNSTLTEHARVVVPQDIQLTEEQRVIVAPETYAVCVRTLLQNWRQGTVACKGRSEVSFSNKKPWKQKGTGRARAGSARSPVWRKGGVVFGPQARTRVLAVPKSQKKLTCSGLLWDFLDNQRVMSLDWTSGDVPKTAYALDMLKKAGLENKKIVLFVSHFDLNTHASFNNISNVRMLLFDQPNVYHLSHGDYWLFLKKDMDAFKKMVGTWL
jgi:large subunit ribosomal protein L4